MFFLLCFEAVHEWGEQTWPNLFCPKALPGYIIVLSLESLCSTSHVYYKSILDTKGILGIWMLSYLFLYHSPDPWGNVHAGRKVHRFRLKLEIFWCFLLLAIMIMTKGPKIEWCSLFSMTILLDMVMLIIKTTVHGSVKDIRHNALMMN